MSNRFGGRVGEDDNQCNSMGVIQRAFNKGLLSIVGFNKKLKSLIKNGQTYNHNKFRNPKYTSTSLDIKSSINIYKRKWDENDYEDFSNEDKNPIAIVLIAHDGTVDIDVLDNDYRRCWWSGDSRAYLKKDSDGSPIGAYHEDSGWAEKYEGVNNADV